MEQVSRWDGSWTIQSARLQATEKHPVVTSRTELRQSYNVTFTFHFENSQNRNLVINLSKITFIIYKPWHLPEKSSGPQLGYSSRSVTRCISFENRSPPSQAETQTNSALNKKLKFVSFSYNKLTDVSHQTMHQYWISIIHILLST